MAFSSFESQKDTLNCILTAKVLLIGDCSTGKTSIFNKIIGNGFCLDTPSTIGIDFHCTEIKLDPNRISTKLSSKLENVIEKETTLKNKKIQITEKILKDINSKKNPGIKLQLWDSAGQEKFRNIVKTYFRNSAIILLVFDLYNRDSFEHLDRWIDQVVNSNKWENNLPLIFLIGNKNDLDITHLVKPISQSEIDKFCNHHKVTSYYSISAKLDEERIKTILVDISHELYFHVEFMRELQISNDVSEYSQDLLIERSLCCQLL